MSAPAPDTDRLLRLNALLEEALALAPEARAAWLDALPADARPLSGTLRGLLARAAGEADGFLREPVALQREALDAVLERDAPGDRIGPWRLLRELGHGGMSTVWLAERADGALQRQVALKLPHAGLGRGLAQRMARERDILARLEHPGIARLYDAGITEGGRPWLAMEHVDGVTIDRYVRESTLALPDRLRLFLKVAEAVRFAHARFVLHRDLKPANILVTADGEVRLLDFGVARLLHGDLDDGGELTRQLGRALTPDYAAPEQLRGEPVGVAGDVYSLGVVLYELLTGERPYAIGRQGAALGWAGALAAVEIVPPSRRAADRRDAAALRGALDAVALQALRADPARRTRSVEALAADIERHLAGEPVLARRETLGEALRRNLRRHRGPIAAGAAVAAALVVGTALALWQAREAAHERDQAQALLARNEAVNEFLTTLLTDGVPPAQAEAVRQMLERGEPLADAAYRKVPEHHAAILRLLAGYWDDPERSDPLLARAAERLRDSPDRALRALVDCSRGQTLEALGRAGEASAMLERWIGDPSTPELAAIECLKLRGAVAHGQSDAAGALRWSQAALERLRALPRPSAAQEAELVGDVAYALYLNGRMEEAAVRFAQSLAGFEAAGRADSPAARVTLNNWGVMEIASGNPRAALARYDALAAAHARLAAGTPPPAWVLGNRAVALDKLGRAAEAIEAYEATSLASLQMTNVGGRVFGLVGMASVHEQQGRRAEAERLLAQADAEAADKVPPMHPARIRAAGVRASLDLAGGRAEPALRALDGLMERLRASGASLSAQAIVLRHRAEAQLAAGHLAAARADADAARALLERLRGDRPHSCDVAIALLTRARIDLAAGDAAAARAAAQQAQRSLEATVDPGHPELQRAVALAR